MWLLWSIILFIIACVMVSKYDNSCTSVNYDPDSDGTDPYICECGGRIVIFTVVYTFTMVIHVFILMYNYSILFTLFGSRKEAKKQ